ncbi:hypothetical protein [Myxococcus virescens]|uniref:Uncharacterized protein n=1 Tax=Myxococcus virescens TaxID=83456 RepID=A0A511HP72_9BACT|nr:hypothetical protein [Myxococcus virescens]GEL75392.1 hypothetical protein MVI01_71760 [Myxococcus virescens]SDE65819.1 hypothetical protein SAMN04488504_109306 [Myxococcus virescens]
MSTAQPHPAVLLRTSLRSGDGHRVTLFDASGPVVSAWDASATLAWREANTLDGDRRRSKPLHRHAHRVTS